jgi:hypothetical protein
MSSRIVRLDRSLTDREAQEFRIETEKAEQEQKRSKLIERSRSQKYPGKG